MAACIRSLLIVSSLLLSAKLCFAAVDNEKNAVGVDERKLGEVATPGATVNPSDNRAISPGLIAGLLALFIGLPAVAAMMAAANPRGRPPTNDSTPEVRASSLCPPACLRLLSISGAPRATAVTGAPESFSRSTSGITVLNPARSAAEKAKEVPAQHGTLTGKAWLEARKAEKAAAAEAEAKRIRVRTRSGSGSGGAFLAGRPPSPGSKPGESDPSALASTLVQYTTTPARRASVRLLLTTKPGQGQGTAYTAPEVGKSAPRRIGDKSVHGVLDEHKGKTLVNEFKDVVQNTTGVDVDVAIKTTIKVVQGNLATVQSAVQANLQSMSKNLADMRHVKVPLSLPPDVEEQRTSFAANPVREFVAGGGGMGVPGRQPPPPRSARVAGMHTSKPTGPPPAARMGVSSMRLAFDPKASIGASHGGRSDVVDGVVQTAVPTSAKPSGSPPKKMINGGRQDGEILVLVEQEDEIDSTVVKVEVAAAQEATAVLPPPPAAPPQASFGLIPVTPPAPVDGRLILPLAPLAQSATRLAPIAVVGKDSAGGADLRSSRSSMDSNGDATPNPSATVPPSMFPPIRRSFDGSTPPSLAVHDLPPPPLGSNRASFSSFALPPMPATMASPERPQGPGRPSGTVVGGGSGGASGRPLPPISLPPPLPPGTPTKTLPPPRGPPPTP